ncbi:MAG: Ig-like domain-containing protein, partial [Sarcina sp.]
AANQGDKITAKKNGDLVDVYVNNVKKCSLDYKTDSVYTPKEFFMGLVVKSTSNVTINGFSLGNGGGSQDVPVSSISLNKSSHTFTDFTIMQLTATVNPSNATNKTIAWASSNSNIASVSSNGLVTAKANGTCTITATSHNNKTSTCSVTIEKDDTSIPVSSISVSPANKICYINDSFSLLATIIPSNAIDKAITWSSSSTSIATVDTTGKVTARAIGNATITARTNNSKTATCNVQVKNKEDGLAGSFQAYKIALTDLREAMNLATVKIAQTKVDIVKNFTITELNKTNKKIGEIDVRAGEVELKAKEIEKDLTTAQEKILSAEQKLTPTSITSSVTEQLSNGGKIDVTSMKLDKSGIETLHDGYSTKVASGWTTCSEPNGDWTYRLGRFFDLYCGKIGSAKDYIGGIRGFVGDTTKKKQMDMVVDADVENGLGIGYTIGANGSADAAKNFMKFTPGGWIHNWVGMNFNNFEIRKIHPNMDTGLEMFSGQTYHHSNCIDTNYSTGNLVFNYWQGYNTTGPSTKVYVNDGTKTGSRGIIYVKSVDARSALRQVQNTNTGIKASYGVTATRDFIDDLYFGTIDEKGEAIIMLSQEFLSQVDTTTKYHVQVTGYNGGTFKIERNQTFIKLTGAINEEFSISLRCVSKQNPETMKAIEKDTMYDEKYMHHSLLDIINDKEKEQLDKFKLNRLADESNRKALKILMQTALQIKEEGEDERHDQ